MAHCSSSLRILLTFVAFGALAVRQCPSHAEARRAHLSGRCVDMVPLTVTVTDTTGST